jgi:hypothetical protein
MRVDFSSGRHHRALVASGRHNRKTAVSAICGARKALDGIASILERKWSIWAYLPVGPLERQLRKGYQGGFWEEVPKNPHERVVTLLW